MSRHAGMRMDNYESMRRRMSELLGMQAGWQVNGYAIRKVGGQASGWLDLQTGEWVDGRQAGRQFLT